MSLRCQTFKGQIVNETLANSSREGALQRSWGSPRKSGSLGKIGRNQAGGTAVEESSPINARGWEFRNLQARDMLKRERAEAVCSQPILPVAEALAWPQA